MNFARTVASFAVLSALAACGGGGSDSSSSTAIDDPNQPTEPPVQTPAPSPAPSEPTNPQNPLQPDPPSAVSPNPPVGPSPTPVPPAPAPTPNPNPTPVPPAPAPSPSPDPVPSPAPPTFPNLEGWYPDQSWANCGTGMPWWPSWGIQVRVENGTITTSAPEVGAQVGQYVYKIDQNSGRAYGNDGSIWFAYGYNRIVYVTVNTDKQVTGFGYHDDSANPDRSKYFVCGSLRENGNMNPLARFPSEGEERVTMYAPPGTGMNTPLPNQCGGLYRNAYTFYSQQLGWADYTSFVEEDAVVNPIQPGSPIPELRTFGRSEFAYEGGPPQSNWVTFSPEGKILFTTFSFGRQMYRCDAPGSENYQYPF